MNGPNRPATNVRQWIALVERAQEDDEPAYKTLARAMVDELGWTAAVDLAAAIRGHVYGTPSYSQHHAAVRPLYEALGWEQAALLACWFRDSRNRPDGQPAAARLELPTSGRRPGGWPAAANPQAPKTTT